MAKSSFMAGSQVKKMAKGRSLENIFVRLRVTKGGHTTEIAGKLTARISYSK